MKNLLILLVTLFCVNTCIAQKGYDPTYGDPKNKKVDTKGFKISNSQLIWQKVYESTETIDQLTTRLKEDGNVKNIEVTDHTIFGNLDDLYADYQGAGYGRAVTPMMLLSQQIICTVTIEFKTNKFRVTIKNMKLKNTSPTPLSPVGEVEPIETYVLKKKGTQFKTGFLNACATILNHTFNKIFENKIEEEDNW